jgi:putative flippase GtrA
LKKQFSLYALIGVLNTGVHWVIFGLLYWFEFSQALSNLAGFLVASLFSYVVNSKVTFEAKLHLGRYLLFMLGMASISLIVGHTADLFELHPLITLVSFSVISLVLGFLWSKLVVFRA